MTTTTKSITFNGKTYTCPFADVMPPLTAKERADLKANIKAHGITVPIVVTPENEVIDGHNRLEIAAELKLEDVPFSVLPNLKEDEKRKIAMDLNVHRRQLTLQQKQDLLATALKVSPELSNNAISKKVGVSDKTVAKKRRELETTSKIPKLPSTVGKDGKSRPSTQPKASKAATPKPQASGAAVASNGRGNKTPHADAVAETAPTTKDAADSSAASCGCSSLADVLTQVVHIGEELAKLIEGPEAEGTPASQLHLAGQLRGAANDLERLAG